MTAERWRLFVAVPLGEELRRELAGAVERWQPRPDLAALRWTDPQTWHVTLAFLGSIEPAAVTDLSSRLEGVVAARAPIRLPTGGVGGFPSAARARVAWYGVRDSSGAFAELARDVRRQADVDDGAFRGHVTLARASRQALDLRQWLRDAAAPTAELAVDRVELMRSHLGRGPTWYEVLESFALGGSARV